MCNAKDDVFWANKKKYMNNEFFSSLQEHYSKILATGATRLNQLCVSFNVT